MKARVEPIKTAVLTVEVNPFHYDDDSAFPFLSKLRKHDIEVC
jgi:hypothetical protein